MVQENITGRRHPRHPPADTEEVGEVTTTTRNPIMMAALSALAAGTLGLATPAVIGSLNSESANSVVAQQNFAPLDEDAFSDVGVLGHRGPRDGVKRPGFGGGMDRPVFGPSAEGR
jgi:hypothetical protein